MKMKRVFGLMTAAGCALYAASAVGAVSESFESATAGDSIKTYDGSNWDGYGTITAATYTGAGDSTVGRPIVQATSNPANVLAVEGRVTRTATTTANNAATVDMMVQIALPDDGLSFPSNVTTEDIQIAVGVDTNATSATTGELKVYCKNKDNVVGWYSLNKTYDKDTWHRVSFTFDYANQLCQIRVDGEPVITANGILKSGSTLNGAWYKLATATAKTALASVQIIGSTSIDDVLVSEAATVAEALPVLQDAASGSTDAGVPYSWIEQQGITRDTTTAPDGSEMTVIQKYAAGYDVADGKKFGLQDMTLSGSDVTLKFNSANIPTGYKYVVETSTDGTNFTTANKDVTGATDGTKELTGELSGGNVKYYRLKLTTAE